MTKQSVRIVAPNNNERGDVFTRRMEDVLHVLGWEEFRFDIHRSGRELDIAAAHRTEDKSLRAECKAQKAPVGGGAINKFAGAVQVEQTTADTQVVAHFISLSGYTETALQQELEADRGIALLDGDTIVRELEAARVIITGERARALAEERASLPTGLETEEDPTLIGHDGGWIWAVFSGAGGDRTHFTLIHASGESLARSLSERVIVDDASSGHLFNGLIESPLPRRVIPEKTDAAREYQSFLRREFGSITFEGLPADGAMGSRSIPLAEIYVPMSVNLEATIDENVEKPRNLTFSTRRSSVADFLAEQRHAAIVGPPGAGKSTVVKWLASDPDVPVGDSAFPIIIRCRTITSAGQRPIRDVITDAIRHAELGAYEESFSAEVAERLSDGSLRLLVDGLDEISSTRDRAAFAGQLRTFLGTYPQIRILITSRPSAFDSVASTLRQTCAIARLADLDDRDITRLCANWQLQVLGVPDPMDDVAAEILRNYRVRMLAVNPLLLTTMLLVKRWLGELPRKRSVLYSKAIEVLAMTWNVEAHEPLDLEEVLPQLGFVALELMESGQKQVDGDELKSLLSDARSEMPELLGYVRTSVGAFVSSVEHRSSILSLVDHVLMDGVLLPQYEFKHLVFQEYLAATAVVHGWTRRKGSYVDLLERHFGDPSWEEVIRLAAMLAGKDAGFLIDALTDFDTGETSPDFELEFRVSDVLVDTLIDEVQIRPDLATRALHRILPHLGMEEDSETYALLDGKFRDLLLEVADAHVEDVTYATSNAVTVFARAAMLDHGTRNIAWISQADGGVAFALENMDSEHSRTQLAALSLAMEAGYQASGNFYLQDLDVHGPPPDINLDEISLMGGMVRDRILSRAFDAPAVRYTATWAMAWCSRHMMWDVPTALDFIAEQVDVWTNRDPDGTMARVLAWSIVEVPPVPEFVGGIDLSPEQLHTFEEVLDAPGDSDHHIVKGAFFVLIYGGKSVEPYASRPNLLKRIVYSAPSEWLEALYPLISDPLAEKLRSIAETSRFPV